MAQQVKSRGRVVKHGEVFTAEREVNAMLDMVAQECERIESRFLEPACGTGNFLAEVLRRKLAVVRSRYRKSPFEYQRYAFVAVSSVYGVELLEDNVLECRERLYGIVEAEATAVLGQKRADPDFLVAVRYVLDKNILCGDALAMQGVNGMPLVFAEWSMVMGDRVKRRDFRYDDLVAGQQDEPVLFAADNFQHGEIDVYIPRTLREYPPIDYRKVRDYG